MADRSIVFNMSLDNKDLEKELNRLNKRIRQMNDQIYKSQRQKMPLIEQARQLRVQLDEALDKLNELQSGKKSDTGTQIQDQIDAVGKLRGEWNWVNISIASIGNGILKTTARLDQTKEKAGAVQQELAATGARAQAMLGVLKRIEDGAGRFALRMKEMASSVLEQAVVSPGLDALQTWLRKAIETDDEAAAAVARLKGALLTMVQPLVAIIIPAFTSFINVLARIAAEVAQVVSMLFGTTTAQSAEAAESLYQETKAIQGVGGAAKKAGKSLASFDEINRLSGDSVSGAGGGYAAGGADFSLVYKERIDEITAYVSGAMLALGAILTFTGVHIPLGLGLMVLGAAGLAATVQENWGAMEDGLREALTNVFALLGGFALVIGAILAFTGINLPLGIGLMAFGAVSLSAAAAVNWGGMNEELTQALVGLLKIVGAFLLVIGLLLALTGVEIPLGIGLIAVGAAALATEAAVQWGMMGASVQSVLSEILMIAAGVLAAVGLVLIATGHIPLGIGLLVAGAAALGTAAALDWGTVVEAVQGPLGEIMKAAGIALLALGLMLLASGVAMPLGIALLAAGAASLVTVAAVNWNAILDRLKEIWGGITGWWNTYVAKYFTADYWMGLGKNMLDGLMGGLSSIGEKISGWGTKFINGVRQFFGINSPSTEFESLGQYMMLGMESGISLNGGLVLAVFSSLLGQMQLETQNTTSGLQTLFAVFLLYLAGEFSVGWANAWTYFQTAAQQSVWSVMQQIDALNAKLASIERNIVITVTTAYRQTGAAAGQSSPGKTPAANTAARFAAMPAVLRAIPMAAGGVIPPNREFLALYGDQRSGNNIETPEALLRKVVREESGGSASDYLLREILAAIREGKVIMVGKKQLGEVVSDALASQARSRGAAIIPV